MSAVVWVTGTQEVEEEAHAAAQGGGSTTTEAGTATEPATTTATGGTTTEPAATGDATAGKQVFASAGCTACHTLADANSTGTVGPNLDEAKPPASLVVDRVTHGKGAMPSFAGQLTDAQIQDVAAYVSSVAGTS
jgi:mono/diheme cytochrome c family protein